VAVNGAQAKGTSARLVVPRDPQVAADELGMDPDGDRILMAEEYLLERGYLTPAGLRLSRGTYTITPAGFDWLDEGPPVLQEPPETVAADTEMEDPARLLEAVRRAQGAARGGLASSVRRRIEQRGS
jgi:hypothetical protein